MANSRTRRVSPWLAGLGLALLVSWRATSPPRGAALDPAELVVKNARVWTADPGQPWAEAVAVAKGRLTFVGSASEVGALIGEGTKVVDAGGRLMAPGFNDSHVHLMSGALALDLVDLIEEQSLAAVQARIKAFAEANPRSAWVRGRGWLYGSFPGGLPTRQQLDAVVSDRPAYMECYDGHSAWANSKALALAGITRSTKDPEGGVIVRDPATGEPTGALKESAGELVARVIPQPDAEARFAMLLRALRLLNSQGITSVQDAGIPVETPTDPAATDAALFARALREGRLSVRIAAAVVMKEGDFERPVAEAARLRALHDDATLRFGRVKGFTDGVIEAHTAAMFEPYADDPAAGLGLPNWTPEGLKKAVVAADQAGLQVYLHAIGDRGVRMALDAYEAAQRAGGPRDRRGRIEHIETIQAADYPRFVVPGRDRLHAAPAREPRPEQRRRVEPQRGEGPRLTGLRLGQPGEGRGAARLRQRLAGGDLRRLPGPLLRRRAQDPARHSRRRLAAGAGGEPRERAAPLHDRRRLRLLRGKREGLPRSGQTRGLRPPVGRPVPLRSRGHPESQGPAHRHGRPRGPHRGTDLVASRPGQGNLVGAPAFASAATGGGGTGCGDGAAGGRGAASSGVGAGAAATAVTEDATGLL